LKFQTNTLEAFQVQRDADEEKQLRKKVSDGMECGHDIQMASAGVPSSTEDDINQHDLPLDSDNEPMEKPLDIDDDEDFTEFARRLDNMYKRSHDNNEKTGEHTKDSDEDDFDILRNDIEEMPPLPPNYIPAASSVPHAADHHSNAPNIPRNDAFNNPYIRIIHTNGIHHIGVVYCTCRGIDNTHSDLMALGFVPTSFTRYRTFFTHAVLDDFRISNLECKASAYQYFQKLRRQTSPMSPDSVPNLYHELRRMSRLWRWMKKLKWAGLAHRPDFTIDPEPGELSNFCPACPQPGINIPKNWDSEPER
jgi:CxC2 like cysteine cluster associated with KDZ transposases